MDKLQTKDFLGMIASGAANLENHENEINTLNVFPVPDGDTGTNMMMTFNNGYKEASGSLSNNICDIGKALAKGLLMGARGNSGVITSQIFRGFSKAIENKNELSTADLAFGFAEGARTAYKAIMKPVEGTILTVIKESAYYANKEYENNKSLSINEYISYLTSYAKESLDRTPELLSTLKEAGVVDSGGAGLFRIFEGFNAFLNGVPITKKDKSLVELTKDALDDEFIGYSINLELLLNNEYRKNFDISIINKRLEAVCELVNLNINNEVLKLDVKTIKPGEVLNVMQRYGEFIKLNVENPTLKDYQVIANEEKEYGIIVVSSGEGLNNLFKELGADKIISGGQTMNPSTADFLNKIDELDNCKTIFIFPNNSNIILAAEQAKSITKKDVVVIPSKSLVSGLSALSLFDTSKNTKDNERTLTDAVLSIKTAEVTYAIKDTCIDGVNVKANDYISIVSKSIIGSCSNLKEICIKTIDELAKHEGYELLTIIAGENSDPALNEEIVAYANNLGKFDVELLDGGQPVYSYLFGLE